MSKKLICVLAGLLAFCFALYPNPVFAGATNVNTHTYSVTVLLCDSSGVSPLHLGLADADTTATFDMRTFTNLATAFTFGANGTGGASGLDSCAMRIYLEATIDDTSWARVDSIEAASITAAKLVEYSGSDTTYVKGWTLPKCMYKGRIIFVADAGIEKDGVLITSKIMKQR